MRQLLTILLVATSPLPYASAAAQTQVATPALLEVPKLDFTKRSLANGATFYAIRDTSAATVSINIWYDVGQRDDPPGRGGFAHLFEHLMFKSTRNLPDGVTKAVTDLGGSTNASTLFDYTDYYVTVPANQLEAMLWIEGERLRNLVVDEQQLQSERNVVKEELSQRIMAQPYGRILYLLLPAFTFDGHPYSRPMGGTAADLDQATLADARAFHQAYYRPDNAIFVVSGNFDPEQLNDWADRYIGSIARPSSAIPRDPAHGRPMTARTIDAYAPGVPLPALAFSWRAPFASDADAAGMDLIEAILTRGAVSRLRRTLIDEKGLASEISSYNLPARDGHAFSLIVTLAKNQELHATEAALAAEIARLRDTALTPAELDAVKNGLFGDALSRRETAQGRAFELGNGAILTGDPRLADNRLDTIRALTPDDVRRIARQWLSDEKRLTLRYRDESQRPAGYTGDQTPDISSLGAVLPAATSPVVTIARETDRERPPAPSTAIHTTPPPIAERHLPNGLRVIVAKSSDVPLASLKLIIDGGDASDPQGQAGRGDLTAALALKGAGGQSAHQLATDMAALGGTITATSDPDATIFAVNVPAANANAAAAILAAVATHPRFPADALDSIRNQQSSSITVVRKKPIQLVVRLLPSIMFGDARYGAVPTVESLARVTRDSIVAVQSANWRPDRSTLIVSGELSPDQGFALAARAFGQWASAAERVGSEQTWRASSPAPPRIIAIDIPGTPQTAVVAALPTIGRNDKEWAALRIANALLGGGFQGWLTQEIRVKRGLSYSAGSMIETRRDAAFLMAATQTKNESAVEVAELMIKQIARLASDPIDPSQARERAAYLASGLSSQTERAAGLGNYLATLVTSGASLDALYHETSVTTPPSPEMIADMVTKYFRADQATLILAGDTKQWLPALRKAYPALELLDVEGHILPLSDGQGL